VLVTESREKRGKKGNSSLQTGHLLMSGRTFFFFARIFILSLFSLRISQSGAAGWEQNERKGKVEGMTIHGRRFPSR
jgi:hypothetical protein